MNEECKSNPVDSAVEQTQKDKSGRERDSKGHFLPKDGSKSEHEKQKTGVEDTDVVKIKVVKEKKPKVPRNIVGKLNDMKERNASRFIESVASNKPQCISIDGVKYYTGDYIGKYKKEAEDARLNEAEAIDCLNEMKEQTESLITTSKSLLSTYENCDKVRLAWKFLAIGLICGNILAATYYFAKSYVMEIGKTTPPPVLTPSAAR